MTGFASLARETDMIVVSVTARSVNHRYLDIQIRAPQVLQAVGVPGSTGACGGPQGYDATVEQPLQILPA